MSLLPGIWRGLISQEFVSGKRKCCTDLIRTMSMAMFALFAAISMSGPTEAAPCRLDGETILREFAERTPCRYGPASTLGHFADYAVCLVDFRNCSGEFVDALDAGQKLTFPYCPTLSSGHCRAVLVLLGELTKPNDITMNDIEDSVVTMKVSRKKRAIKKSVSKRQMMKLLRKYQLWRKKHGYGRVVGRWGRDLRRVNELARTGGDADDMQRQKREAFKADSDVSVAELLKAYKSWRTKNGYGKANGRWGKRQYSGASS